MKSNGNELEINSTNQVKKLDRGLINHDLQIWLTKFNFGLINKGITLKLVVIWCKILNINTFDLEEFGMEEKEKIFTSKFHILTTSYVYFAHILQPWRMQYSLAS
jgi:hypothetical protein